MLIDGAMVMWWVLTVPALLFVSIDIWRNTPESPVLKWAFVILTAFTGPIGAFLYVLGCREPLPGSHEHYVSARWRQVLGSTMHCVAGDGVGIVVGAAIGSMLTLSFWPDFLLQYALGFGFGWAFFQAFAMRGEAGGSYRRSLRMTFLPELLSMNLLMAGMLLAAQLAMLKIPGADDPAHPRFWFVMSMGLIIGFVFAYPVNWWLVTNHMKHGMMTVRSTTQPAMAGHDGGHGGHDGGHGGHDGHGSSGSRPAGVRTAAMTALTFAILGVALAVVTHLM
jgi:hypothetical protein